jgi:hypothetical protein
MSCEGKIYIGQIGVLLEVDTQGTAPDCPPVDWADATDMTIKVRLPDRTETEFPATLSGTKLQYITTSADDLPIKGRYLLQAHVAGPGYDALGETDEFTVYDRWK